MVQFNSEYSGDSVKILAGFKVTATNGHWSISDSEDRHVLGGEIDEIPEEIFRTVSSGSAGCCAVYETNVEALESWVKRTYGGYIVLVVDQNNNPVETFPNRASARECYGHQKDWGYVAGFSKNPEYIMPHPLPWTWENPSEVCREGNLAYGSCVEL